MQALEQNTKTCLDAHNKQQHGRIHELQPRNYVYKRTGY